MVPLAEEAPQQEEVLEDVEITEKVVPDAAEETVDEPSTLAATECTVEVEQEPGKGLRIPKNK
jgi:hypothetical protein